MQRQSFDQEEYLHKLEGAGSLYSITQIAKDYGMSGQTMNTLLHSLGVQYQIDGQWLLYSKYQDKGYTHSKTLFIEHHEGDEAKMHTCWTGKGRVFLYRLLRDEGILPLIERES